MKKLVITGILFLMAALLSGCKTAELEDRDFPIEVAVTQTQHFSNEWLNAEQDGNRVVDYNHLKVMILSQEFIEDKNGMEELLTMLEKKNDVPRNTYLAVAREPEKLMALKGEDGESVGDYLEELFENVSDTDKKVYPTLGMMYQEQENRRETLFIPYVGEADKKPVIEGFYVWKRGRAAGKVDDATAMLSFFTQNRRDDYTLSLDKENVVRLFAPHNDLVFRKDSREIVVNVVCSGEMLYQNPKDAYSREDFRTMAEKYMNGVASSSLEKAKDRELVDVTNSFKKLGGYDRDEYMVYRKDSSWYEEGLRIVYHVQIDWVNM